jgi:hypothetical protein
MLPQTCDLGLEPVPQHRLHCAVDGILLSTGIAGCLVLLMVNDRPFNAGGITIQPDVLREVGHD